jgi:hypothetical protein
MVDHASSVRHGLRADGLFSLDVTIDVVLLAGATVAAGRLLDPAATAFRSAIPKRSLP